MPQGLLEQAQFTWADYFLDIWETGEWESQHEEDREYGQQHLVEHIDEAGMPDDVLYGLISKEWRDAWSNFDPTYTGYLNDISRIWRRADAAKNLAVQVKCALCRSTAAAFSSTIPDELLNWSLVTGQLDAEQALYIVQRKPDHSERSSALLVLIPELPESALPLALETVGSIGRAYDSLNPAVVLERLIPRLSGALLNEAVAYVRSIRNPSMRARASTALIPRHPGELRLDLAAETLEIVRTIYYQRDLAQELVRLAPHLPDELMPEAIDLARAIEGDESRIRALTGIIPFLEGDLRGAVLTETIDMARVMEPEEVHAVSNLALRARALADLVPYLAGRAREDLINDVLEIVSLMKDLNRGAEVVGILGPHLSRKLLAKALAIGTAFPEFGQAQVLEELAPYLSQEQLAQALVTVKSIPSWYGEQAREALGNHLSGKRTAVAGEALDAARNISDPQDRTEAMSELIAELDVADRAAVVIEALDAARIIKDDDIQSRLLEELDSAMPIEDVAADAHAYYGLLAYDDEEPDQDWEQTEMNRADVEEENVSEEMPEKMLAERLDAARTAEEAWQKISILAELAPHLTEKDELAALALIEAVNDADDRLRALAELAPFLTEARLTQALEVEQLVNSQWGLSESSRALLPYLPEEILVQTWEAVKSIQHEDGRRLALLDLLPLMPHDRIDEAMEIGFSIGDYDESAEAMIGLAPYVPDEAIERVITEALDAIQLAENEDDYPEPFLRILPYVPDHMLEKALEVAGSLFVQDEEWRRATAFQGMGHYLQDWVARQPEEAYAGWQAALRRAADNPRPAFLRDLTGLHYFALILAGDNETEAGKGIRQVIEEVCAW